MKNRFLLLGKAALFFLGYFIVARLFFHLYLWSNTVQMGWGDFFQSYLYGLRLDASITGYLMMFLAIVMPFSMVMPACVFRGVVDGFVAVFIATFSLLIWADAVLYTHWGFRIDTSFFMYLETPKEAMASVPVWQLIVFLLAWGAYSALFIWLFRRFVSSEIIGFERSHWAAVFAFLLFGGCMILPVRGSVGIAPVNTGMVYFSSNLYTNHSTVNAVWNFMYDLSHRDRTNLTVNFMEAEKAESIRSAFIARPDSVPAVLNQVRPNVLLIILEGVAAQVIEPLGGRKGVTPNINQLWNEGVAFNHVYASGSRSDRGLVAILSGYPSHPLASLMKYPKKTQKVNSLTRVLGDAGYSTTFYYGGDTDFANMNSYLKNTGFKNVVNQDSFPKEYRNSKWGVHDGYAFDRVMNDMDAAQTPFFKAFFTLSSHEPFDVPMSTVIEGSGDNEKYMNSVFYTDSCLGHFIRQAKSKPWWKNTLIVIVSDHNVRYIEDYRIDEARRYAIPMIWTGGAIKQPMKIDTYASQCDVAATLLKQMNLPVENLPFSNDIFAPENKGGAIYHFNKGFGYISSEGHVIYDLNKNQLTESSGVTQLIQKSEGLFQSMIDDFNRL